MNFNLHVEKITDTIRKRRLSFYGHLTRMNSGRLSNRICAYFVGKKTKGIWFTEVEKDLQELGLSHEDILVRDSLKKKLGEIQSFQPKPILKTGKKWTEERKEAHRRRMREYWANVKERGKRQLK